MKLCSKCNIEKDDTEFRYRNKTKTTLQCWCRECERVWIKQWKIDNKLDYTGTDNFQSMPTLDIIDPSNIDITLDKIQIVCHRCNMSKGTMSEHDFVLYCSKIVKLHGDKYGCC